MDQLKVHLSGPVSATRTGLKMSERAAKANFERPSENLKTTFKKNKKSGSLEAKYKESRNGSRPLHSTLWYD